MAAIRIFASTILRRNLWQCIEFPKKSHNKMVNLEQIVENNKRNEEILSSITTELDAMQQHMIYLRKKQLRAENDALQKQVETAKAQLIALELSHGKKQVVLPSSCHQTTRGLCTTSDGQKTNRNPTAAPIASATDASLGESKQKPIKEKKMKKEKTDPTTTASSTATEAAIDVGRLDMRIGKIVEVSRHPDADSLYLEKIDCGEPQTRTVVSGLVKYVPLEEMQNRMVVVLCNLKPAKMRGVTSEAMVMCASTPEKVEVLSPPVSAVPGDLVHCEGYTRQPDVQLNPKKKIFEICAPDLQTNGELIACYKDAALHVPGKGNIVAQTLKNVQVK